MLLCPPYYLLNCVFRRSWILHSPQNVVVCCVLCSAYANVDKESSHGNRFYKRKVMRLPLGATTCIWKYIASALRLHGRWTMVFSLSSFFPMPMRRSFYASFSCIWSTAACKYAILVPQSCHFLFQWGIIACNYKVIQIYALQSYTKSTNYSYLSEIFTLLLQFLQYFLCSHVLYQIANYWQCRPCHLVSSFLSFLYAL